MNRPYYNYTKPKTRNSKLSPVIRADIRTEFGTNINAFRVLGLSEYIRKEVFYAIMRGEDAQSNHISVVEKSWNFYNQTTVKLSYLQKAFLVGLNCLNELVGRELTEDEFFTELVKAKRTNQL